MGDKVLATGSGYSYDPKTGEIEIKNVTAEVSIKASGGDLPSERTDREHRDQNFRTDRERRRAIQM